MHTLDIDLFHENNGVNTFRWQNGCVMNRLARGDSPFMTFISGLLFIINKVGSLVIVHLA
jgi:hypothetical protein